jgi:hypothetical protein
MKTPIEWAFEHMYYMDFANASIHQTSVRFSPLTFSLAEEITEWLDKPSKETMILVSEVMSHKGQYKIDEGR